MGGEIGFVSEPKIGSTFSFTGCLRKGEDCSLDAKWQHCDPSLSEFRGLKALVIDDRSVRAEVTKYHLERLGVSVDMASDMESASSRLSSNSRYLVEMYYIEYNQNKENSGLESGSVTE